MQSLMKADTFPLKVIGDNSLVNSNNSVISESDRQFMMTFRCESEIAPLCILVSVCHGDHLFTTAFSPYDIPGNYPLQSSLLFGLTLHADGSIISPTIDSSFVEVWPLDAGSGLRIVLDRAQWLKARKSPTGLPLIYNTHSFLNVVIRAQFCGDG